MIRQLYASDIRDASSIADTCYDEPFHETEACYLKKFLSFPAGCVGSFIRDKLIGFAIGHPWKGDFPKLNMEDFSIPLNPDHYWFHDLVVDPQYRGYKVGYQLYDETIKITQKHGFHAIRLVSVGPLEKFLKSRGFREIAQVSYGEKAYPVLELT